MTNPKSRRTVVALALVLVLHGLLLRKQMDWDVALLIQTILKRDYSRGYYNPYLRIIAGGIIIPIKDYNGGYYNPY